jgi:hypothetical protein
LKHIVIIDDNSNPTFLRADHEYKNLTIVQGKNPGRGELLAFFYFLMYKWFPKAIIVHDSVFIHQRIPFELMRYPVLPLWHANYDRENISNALRIIQPLTNRQEIVNKLSGTELEVLGFPKPFNICFGSMCCIELSFLQSIQRKYQLSQLVHTIRNREDRCSFERILGAILTSEYRHLVQHPSLFGLIFSHHKAWKYNWNQYMEDLQAGRSVSSFVKIWTGR